MVGLQPGPGLRPGPGRTKRSPIQSIQSWLAGGLELLFPIHCVGCGTANSSWCAACDGGLDRYWAPFCPTCGASWTGPAPCPSCARRRPDLPARAYARYTGRLVPALLHLKYRPDRKLAGLMAGWLASLVDRTAWPATTVVPVPLGPGRLQQRGFNQAELLARALTDRLGLPLSRDLRRTRETRSQVGLDPRERRLNVSGAFGAEPGSFAGEAVLLVDDLHTTGATLAACAQALFAAGASQVWGVTVGRA